MNAMFGIFWRKWLCIVAPTPNPATINAIRFFHNPRCDSKSAIADLDRIAYSSSEAEEQVIRNRHSAGVELDVGRLEQDSSIEWIPPKVGAFDGNQHRRPLSRRCHGNGFGYACRIDAS